MFDVVGACRVLDPRALPNVGVRDARGVDNYSEPCMNFYAALLLLLLLLALNLFFLVCLVHAIMWGGIPHWLWWCAVTAVISATVLRVYLL